MNCSVLLVDRDYPSDKTMFGDIFVAMHGKYLNLILSI